MKRPEATKKRGTRWFSGQSVVMGVGFDARMETLIGALVEGTQNAAWCQALCKRRAL